MGFPVRDRDRSLMHDSATIVPLIKLCESTDKGQFSLRNHE